MSDNRTNYVCTVCSQTFTRKTSAERHRVNNHPGTFAPFVKFIDYIIGKIEGRYQANDPVLYRHKKKNVIKS
jgi:transposase-like protein